MAIPDTNTFSLQDVVTEINPTTDDLVDCFADSVDGNFDVLYKGSKNQLLNFRNYGAVIVFIPTYGYLYNITTALHINFCLVGWHIPTYSETADLITFGGSMKETGFTHWFSPNTGATNSFNFYGIGSGNRHAITSAYSDLKTVSYFWLNTTYGGTSNYGAMLRYDTNVVSFEYYINFGRAWGFSVRLVKDNSTWTEGDTVTDYDGNIYPTCKIGNTVWTSQNWKCTKLNNGTLIPTITDNTTWSFSPGTLAKCAYNNDLNNV